MSTITIQIPDSLHRHVERLAAEDRITVDQFFATAASEKLSVIEAVDYIAARAARANDTDFLKAVSQIPNAPVTEEWDKMP